MLCVNHIFTFHIFSIIGAVKKKNIVGARVRKARKMANLEVTQEDLAARLQLKGLKIDQAMISRIEKGERLVTDIEVKALAQALKVSPGWLIEGKPDRP